MLTNYANRRVKLRIERAKFQFALIVFLQKSSVIVQLSHKKKTMDSDESYHSELYIELYIC